MKTILNEQQKWVNRHWWLAGLDLDVERQQARDEGRAMGRWAAEFTRLLKVPVPAAAKGHLGGRRDDAWFASALRLTDRMQTLPLRRDYPHSEPSDLPGIRAERPRSPALAEWRGRRAEFLRRLHGGWLGRIAGCMLGKPVEVWPRARIRLQAEATGNWPLHDYFRQPTAAQARRLRRLDKDALFQPHLDHQMRSTHPGLRGAIEDDDLNYTVIGLAVVKRHGAAFTPADVATCWLNQVPIGRACTAERVAYRNFADCVTPPLSASVRNPYREWIGAQIRADFFGYANPGRPERAAEWAWRDACISHVRNGIYGEMWVAAMLAAAYVERDWPRVIRAGLAQIPARSRLREAIEQVLADHAAGLSYDTVVEKLHRQWNEKNFHHWCHTISNAQVVAIALLWGEHDFEQTITRAVMPGFDTDCNGATAGSLWGICHGVDALPAKWTRPLRDTVRTGVSGYHEVSIRRLAEDMADVALKHAP